ncbi:hypothetical protein BGZ90_005284 [Linnemannia elongata]|nr:hypothetical protein BGZ90_005284 [Linnemannia elongata]
MTTPSASGNGHHPTSVSSSRRNLLAQSSKHQNSQSFADFFSASTPVPASVTLLLSYTSPAIHAFHRLLQLLTWTSDRSVKSFLVLFAWWAICLGTESFIIFGLHGVLILYIGRMWVKSRKANKIAVDGMPQSPTTPLSGKFSFSSNRAETYFDWSDRSRTQLVLGLVILSYVPWLILTYFIPMRFIMVVAGTIVICWRAPWFAILWAVTMKLETFSPLLQLIPYWPFRPETGSNYQVKRKFSVKDIISRAIGQRKKNDADAYKTYKTSTGYDIEEDHATMYYKFVLYENQRWWLGLEWTPMMLPNDRAPWTDDHLEPTQSKSAFQLPPPHVAHEAIPGQPNKVLRKSQEWRWLDPSWRLKLGSGSDVDGWEFANNHWQKWSGKNRRGAYTRRRAWERTAKLIDQREVVLLEDVQDELKSVQHDHEEEAEVEEEEEEEEEEGEEEGEDEEEEEEEEEEEKH